MDLKSYKWAVLIALLQGGISTILQIDKHFFTYEEVTNYMIIAKIGYFIFLVVAWCFIAIVINRLKENDSWNQEVFL